MGAVSDKPNNYAFDGPGISQYLFQKCPAADGFDFPVGKPNARGYYNAQKFGRNFHLGDDWNGNGGGNSDLKDPVYSIAHGIVISAKREPQNWGNVVRVLHNTGTRQKPVYIESVYAHLDKIHVRRGKVVRRGQKIGTIGNVGGVYLAHLHLEIRDTINKAIGDGYDRITTGYLNPTRFIKKSRPRYRKRKKIRRTKIRK